MSATEIICGTHAVLEAIRAGKRRVLQVYIATGKAEKMAGVVEQEARRHQIPCKKVSGEDLFKMSRVEKNQGIAANAPNPGIRASLIKFSPVKLYGCGS